MNAPTYVDYGGDTSSYTPAQLNVAFVQAELGAERYLQTYMQPTNVTGVYVYPMQANDRRLYLGVNYVRQVYNAVPLMEYPYDTTLETNVNGYAFILDAERGIIDLRLKNIYYRYRWQGSPYQVQVAFNAGLDPSLKQDPNLLAALKALTDMWLMQNFDPSNFAGGIGDPGIQSWSSLDYNESRVGTSLKSTMFGNSPQANMIVRLLRPFRKYKAMHLPRT